MLWTYAGGWNKILFLDMKRILLILLIVCTFNNIVNAQNKGGETYPKFTFGLEWGYVATLHSSYHYYFYAPEGFRVEEKGNILDYKSNADMYLNIGWNISTVWNLSAYVGYAGAGNYHNVIPLSLRGTRYFGDNPMTDRWFVFIDLGSGICLKTPLQEIFAGKIGGGYQLSLSRDTKLSFLFSARSTFTHPSIYYDGLIIPMGNTNRNNALISALSIGMGLTF